MEWKIGEIKQVNGEWYQCVRAIYACNGCSFRTTRPCDLMSECSAHNRSDGYSVIYKKLEKVGEPYFNGQYGEVLQEYKYYIPPITSDLRIHIIRLGIVGIELKQNKEDMEEKELDPRMAKVIDEATQKMGEEIGSQIEANINKQRMKPFNLELAKQGKPVCTRDGRKARIICFDLNNDAYPIVVAITNNGEENEIHKYSIDGKICTICTIKEDDLMMLPEKKEGWIIVSKNATIYDSLEDAKKSFDSDKELCICKVEWEE